MTEAELKQLDGLKVEMSMVASRNALTLLRAVPTLLAEVRLLNAENARLRKALKTIANGQTDYGDCAESQLHNVEIFARDALIARGPEVKHD